MGLTRVEQETVIRWDEEDKTVRLWSSSPMTWRRLARLGLRPVKESTMDGKASGKSYVLPLERFRWGLKSEARAAARRGRGFGASP